MTEATQRRWHIVVATDLSPASAQAYRYAAAMAKALDTNGGCRVTLLTVTESGFLAGGDPRKAFADYFESVDDAREAALERAVSVFERWGVPVTPGERGGTPFRTIAAFATEEDADLIVLARHTRGPIPRRLLGSTVKRLMRVTPVPVLVVPVDDGVGEAMEAGLPTFKHVMMSTDFSELAGEGMARTHRLARRLGASLTAVHVNEPIMWVPLFTGATLPATPNGLLSENKEAALARLHDQIKAIGGSADITPVVAQGFPAEALCKTARQTGVDLIALSATGKGATERFFLGSTAEQVAAEAHVPVLVWPNKDDARLGAAD